MCSDKSHIYFKECYNIKIFGSICFVIFHSNYICVKIEMYSIIDHFNYLALASKDYFFESFFFKTQQINHWIIIKLIIHNLELVKYFVSIV